MDIIKRRSWTSTLLLFALIGLGLTGLLSYSLPYSAQLSGLHTWFGFIFLLIIIMHVINNGKSLFGYFRKSAGNKQLWSGVLLVSLVFTGVMVYLPPFSSVIETGYKLRKIQAVEDGNYQIISTRVAASGRPLTIAIRAGDYYESDPQPLFLGLTYKSTPQMVFWIEDDAGNYIETLYVTKKLASAGFRLSDDIFSKDVVRRPEALPYWSHKRGKTYSDGLFVPDGDSGEFDGITAPTPLGHFDLRTTASGQLGRFRVLMEINRSYDFNDHYHRHRYPDDAVYSGSGSSGQPSVIYQAIIDTSAYNTIYVMKPIGHGHYSGKDGKLYRDMSGIDSALRLIDRAIVTL